MRSSLLSGLGCVALMASPVSAQTSASEKSEEPTIELSGIFRERLTYVDNVNFEPDNEENGWFLIQRIGLAADADLTPYVRARVSLVSGVLEGEAFERIQRNDLDVQEAYLELGPQNAFLRVGRQELQLGSQRLVATRDGTNIRRSWDGARGVLQAGNFTLQAMVLSEVEVEPAGVFNDPIAEGDTISGVYVSGPAPIGNFDAYFLHSNFDARRTIEGTAEQDRYTLGARWFGTRGKLFWDWEALYQFGDHGDFDISAWSVAANTGLRFEDVAWKPEFMLSTNIASGDSDNGDGTLGTFDALFPRGNYFSQAAILGPSNFYNIHPSVTVFPDPDLELFADVNFYWRLEEEDGIYGPPFVLLREPGASDARFVNTSVSAGATWNVSENVQLAVIGTHSSAGRFIEETGPAQNISFVEFTAQYSF